MPLLLASTARSFTSQPPCTSCRRRSSPSSLCPCRPSHVPAAGGFLGLLLAFMAYQFRRKFLCGCCKPQEEVIARVNKEELFGVASVVHSMSDMGRSTMSMSAPK